MSSAAQNARTGGAAETGWGLNSGARGGEVRRNKSRGGKKAGGRSLLPRRWVLLQTVFPREMEEAVRCSR